MNLYVDEGINADWTRTLGWALPTETHAFLDFIGAGRNMDDAALVKHFMTLPVAANMPAELRTGLVVAGLLDVEAQPAYRVEFRDWSEDLHPRDETGKFTDGGGSSKQESEVGHDQPDPGGVPIDPAKFMATPAIGDGLKLKAQVTAERKAELDRITAERPTTLDIANANLAVVFPAATIDRKDFAQHIDPGVIGAYTAGLAQMAALFPGSAASIQSIRYAAVVDRETYQSAQAWGIEIGSTYYDDQKWPQDGFDPDNTDPYGVTAAYVASANAIEFPDYKAEDQHELLASGGRITSDGVPWTVGRTYGDIAIHEFAHAIADRHFGDVENVCIAAYRAMHDSKAAPSQFSPSGYAMKSLTLDRGQGDFGEWFAEETVVAMTRPRADWDRNTKLVADALKAIQAKDVTPDWPPSRQVQRDWDPADHPRDETGKFTDGGGGGVTVHDLIRNSSEPATERLDEAALLGSATEGVGFRDINVAVSPERAAELAAVSAATPATMGEALAGLGKVFPATQDPTARQEAESHGVPPVTNLSPDVVAAATRGFAKMAALFPATAAAQVFVGGAVIVPAGTELGTGSGDRYVGPDAHGNLIDVPALGVAPQGAQMAHVDIGGGVGGFIFPSYTRDESLEAMATMRRETPFSEEYIKPWSTIRNYEEAAIHEFGHALAGHNPEMVDKFIAKTNGQTAAWLISRMPSGYAATASFQQRDPSEWFAEEVVMAMTRPKSLWTGVTKSVFDSLQAESEREAKQQGSRAATSRYPGQPRDEKGQFASDGQGQWTAEQEAGETPLAFGLKHKPPDWVTPPSPVSREKAVQYLAGTAGNGLGMTHFQPIVGGRAGEELARLAAITGKDIPTRLDGMKALNQAFTGQPLAYQYGVPIHGPLVPDGERERDNPLPRHMDAEQVASYVRGFAKMAARFPHTAGALVGGIIVGQPDRTNMAGVFMDPGTAAAYDGWNIYLNDHTPSDAADLLALAGRDVEGKPWSVARNYEEVAIHEFAHVLAHMWDPGGTAQHDWAMSGSASRARTGTSNGPSAYSDIFGEPAVGGHETFAECFAEAMTRPESEWSPLTRDAWKTLVIPWGAGESIDYSGARPTRAIRYSPDQPRDEKGRFGSKDGGDSGVVSDSRSRPNPNPESAVSGLPKHYEEREVPIGDLVAVYRQATGPADLTGDIETMRRYGAVGYPDALPLTAYHVAEQLGFDGLPTVVDRGHFLDVVDNGGIEMYRGVATTANADQFRDGALFMGVGIWGHGVYVAGPHPDADQRAVVATENIGGYGRSVYSQQVAEARNTANGYANYNAYPYNGNPDGATMRMALVPGAKTISADEVTTRMQADWAAQNTKTLTPTTDEELNAQKRDFIMSDPGIWAMQHGYDAIYDGTPGSGSSAIWLITNRTALVVQKENEWTAGGR